MKKGKNSIILGTMCSALLWAGLCLPAYASTDSGVPESKGSPFTDVADAHPYAGSILSLHRSNIMEGTGDRTFSPDSPLTRGQFAKMAVTAFKPPAYEGDGIFSDVQNHWSKSYVLQAFGAGYVEGSGPFLFEPDLPLSGQAAGTMIWRILSTRGIASPATSVPAATVEADEWAADSINQLLRLNIWPMSPDNKPVQPKQTMTRAQAAALLDLSLRQWNMANNKNNSSSTKPKETGESMTEAIPISSPGEYKSALSNAWFKLQWPEKRTLQLQSEEVDRLMLTDREGKRISLSSDKPLVFTAEANNVYYISGIGSISVLDGSSTKNAYTIAGIKDASLLPPIALPKGKTAFFNVKTEATKHYKFELKGSTSSMFSANLKLSDRDGRKLKSVTGSSIDMQIPEAGTIFLELTSDDNSPSFSLSVLELGTDLHTPIFLTSGQYTISFAKDGELKVSVMGHEKRPIYMHADNARNFLIYQKPPDNRLGTFKVPSRPNDPLGYPPNYIQNDRTTLLCTLCIISIVSNGQPATTIRLTDGLSIESAYELDIEARSELPYKVSKTSSDPGNIYVKTILKKGVAYQLEAVEKKGWTPDDNVEYKAAKFDIYDGNKKLVTQDSASRTSFVPTEDGVYYILMKAGSDTDGYDVHVRKPLLTD